MFGFEDIVRELLIDISHYPLFLYLGVIVFLTASSFGLPVPEEVVLITCGMVAYLAIQEGEELGQPPNINAVTLSIHCFFAVLLSDLLVFTLGRTYGLRMMRTRPFSRFITEEMIEKTRVFVQKYGALACGIFRFTPGLRFPGHFMCGAMHISYTKFFLTDGVAALLSVPTQVMLLAYYGDEILYYFKRFKMAIFAVLIVLLIIWIVRRFRQPSPTAQ